VTEKETAFERVIRTNTLRCGYAVATPWFWVDAKTGEKTGVGFDVTNAIAEKTGLKIEWAEETGWGTAEQGLITGRYDALCASVCVDANRVRAASYAAPYLHLPILAVVRDDDHRFDSGLETINKTDVRIGVKDNHVFEYAAKERFPNAGRVYLNDISDDTEFLTMLATGKVDIAFAGQSTVDLYNEKNDKKLRSLAEPARYCHGGFMIPSGDTQLKEMLDAAILQMNTGGQLQAIMDKYVKRDPRYVRLPAVPYQ
jgi:polar amino acid transport system substrate-binding protein